MNTPKLGKLFTKLMKDLSVYQRPFNHRLTAREQMIKDGEIINKLITAIINIQTIINQEETSND